MTTPVDLRIATWNVDHARNRSRDADRLALIDAANADVLVLTETRDEVRPTEAGYEGVHCGPRPQFPPDERWVSIWTPLSVIDQIPTKDPLRTAAALLAHSAGELLVYGTVLPWHADVGDAREDPAPKRWAEHRRVVADQAVEWQQLHAQFPNATLVIAGDWNTDLLAGSGKTRYPYGPTNEARLLMDTMLSVGLDIPTRGIEDPGPQRRFLIDHIATPSAHANVETRPAVCTDGATLSDHPMVVVSVGAGRKKIFGDS